MTGERTIEVNGYVHRVQQIKKECPHVGERRQAETMNGMVILALGDDSWRAILKHTLRHNEP